MAIDSSIYQLAGRGVKSVADYDNEAAQAQQNKLALMMGGMKMDEAKRGIADQNTLRGVYAQFGSDTAANTNALYGAGLGKEAGAYAKSAQDMAKDKADTQKTQMANTMQKLALGSQLLGGVTDQASYDAARQTAQASGLDVSRMPPAYDPTFVAQKLKEGQTVKEQFDQHWKAMEYSSPNANAVLAAKTSTDNNNNSNATSRANNSASVGATMRGQNMTDARSRDTIASTMTKPFEVTGPDGTPVLVRQDKQGNISRVEGFGPKAGSDKPMTDGQSKAALFGSRMEAADKILGTLAGQGTQTSIPGAKAGYGIGSMVNMASSGAQQQLEQAKRDFVNAVLRRESGAVIADSEFANADKQYFPQVGDSAAVIAQKASNRAIATRGIQAEVPKAQRGVIKSIINGDAAPNIDSLLDKYK
jgi:hypothetical protein